MAITDIAFKLRDKRVFIKCAKCPAETSMAQVGSINPQAVAKRFALRGWQTDPDAESHNICPDCLKAKKDEYRKKHGDPNHTTQVVLNGHPITTHIKMSIIPSPRRAGAQTLVIETPRLFAPKYLTMHQHNDAGIILYNAVKGGVPGVDAQYSRRFYFDSDVVYFQMPELVSEMAIEAQMRTNSISVERLPDKLLPIPLRAIKPVTVPFLAPAAATPAAKEIVAKHPLAKVDAFAHLEKVMIRMSLIGSSDRSQHINLSLPKDEVDTKHSRISVEQENEGFKIVFRTGGGNKLSELSTSPKNYIIALGKKHWWFDFPDNPFSPVPVPAYIDPDTGSWHVPKLPPMLEKIITPETKASLPRSTLGQIDNVRRGKARKLLEQFFREDDGMYTNNYTDRRVAAEADMPQDAVVELREFAYGPLNERYLEIYKIEDQITDLQIKLRDKRAELQR